MNQKIIYFGKIIKLFSFNFLKKCEPGIRVSYTHEIKDEDLSNFEENIKFLLTDHTFISPEQFFEYLDSDNIPDGKFILMTFDDGFLSSYTAAKKILNSYNIKAIFFVPTGILDLKSDSEMLHFTKHNVYFDTIDSKELVPEEYRYMNLEKLVDLKNDGHMICPHTHSHIWIKNITNKEMVEKELIEPKRTVEKLMSTKVRAFAFPVGTEKQVSNFAYQNIYQNYDFCFTALTGTNTIETNKHKLHRFNLPGDAPKVYLDMAINGVYDVYYSWKMSILTKKIEQA